MKRSSALRWPVTSPWKLRRGQGPTAWLSSQQRALLLYVAWMCRPGGHHWHRRTLEEFAAALDVTSRGQISRELRRLRQLELIGYTTRRGPHGWHAVFLTRQAAKLRAVRHVRARVNDSTSTPFGGFIRRSDVANAWQEDRRPPGPGGNGARAGPRRGRPPPHVVYEDCPAGHRTRIRRRSWMATPDALVAVWSGPCSRCGAVTVGELRLAVPPERRLPSPAERADPELIERRRRQAEAFRREGLAVPAELARYYLEEPPGAGGSS